MRIATLASATVLAATLVAGGALAADGGAALQGEHHELVGRQVIGQNGGTVGEINNVLVDAQGTPTHVVLDHGGWLGMGEKSIALGLDKLQVTRDDVRVTLSDDQLSALPGYEEEGEAGSRREAQSASDPGASAPAETGAPARQSGQVGSTPGPSGSTLQATPGVMTEPAKPQPAD